MEESRQYFIQSLDGVKSLTQIFCVLPKRFCEVSDYGVSLSELDDGKGYVLSIVDMQEGDEEKIESFLEGALDKETQGYLMRRDDLGIHIQFSHGDILMELLINYFEKGNHSFSKNELKKINDGIDEIIKRETFGVFNEGDAPDELNMRMSPKDQICDIFNTLLETAGLSGHEAYYQLDDNDNRFEISIDADGNNDPEFVKFCEEIIDAADGAGVVSTVMGEYNQLFLDAENELEMLKVLRAYFHGYKLYTAEDMISGGATIDHKAVIDDGKAYMKLLGKDNCFVYQPMIPTISGDSGFLCKLFYLKSNETTSINLDQIETVIHQENGDYELLGHQHRPFVIH